MSLFSRMRGSKGYGACGDAAMERECPLRLSKNLFFDSLKKTPCLMRDRAYCLYMF